MKWKTPSYLRMRTERVDENSNVSPKEDEECKLNYNYSTNYVAGIAGRLHPHFFALYETFFKLTRLGLVILSGIFFTKVAACQFKLSLTK